MVSSAKKFDSWMGSKKAGKATLPPLPPAATAALAKGRI